MHSVIERGALAGALEFVERGAEQHGAGRAERMAHRDRAAVDVDLLRIELNACRKRSTTEANASLTSNRSMSAMRHAARARTFLVTSTGPVSMIAGSQPILAKARIFRARLQAGRLARLGRAQRAPPPRRRQCPTNCRHDGHASIFSIFGMGICRHRVEAALLAHHHERGLQRGERLHVGRGRMCSSWASKSDAVDVACTGATEFLNRPSSRPLPRVVAIRPRIASTSSRENPYFVAMRSAETPCGMK